MSIKKHLILHLPCSLHYPPIIYLICAVADILDIFLII